MYSLSNGSRNALNFTQDGGWWEATEQKSSPLNSQNPIYTQTCSNLYPLYPSYNDTYVYNDYQQSNFYYDCYSNIGLTNYNMFDCQPNNENINVDYFPTITYGNAYSLLPSCPTSQIKPEIQDCKEALKLRLLSMSSSPQIPSDTDLDHSSNSSSLSIQSIKAKPFVCKHCERGFARNHDLNRHVKIHTNVRKFSCDHCKKRFYRKDLWRRHSLTKKCNNIQVSGSA